MKKIVLSIIAVTSVTFAMAQLKPKKDYSKLKIDRAGDHIMLQLSSDHWAGASDSITTNIKGFARGLNLYLMLDKRFKNNPMWSIAFGLGISNSNIFFKNQNVSPNGINVASGGTTLPFPDNTGEHFKKYKLATTYLELPIELRYTFNPEDENKSWKAAIGIKLGALLNAHTKGKTLQDQNNNTIDNYAEKISSTKFFDATRVAATARVGYGHYSLFGSYALTPLLKDGNPGIMPYQIGITLSGL